MRRGLLGLFALLGLPLLPAGPQPPRDFPHAPPPAYTGGFDEPTCSSCHFDVDEPDPAGGVTLAGLPERFTPGARYPITVTVRRPGMGRAGFQLAARFAEGGAAGRQAGTLLPAGPGALVTEHREVGYASQTEAGTTPDPEGRASWQVVWVAPAGAAGAVRFDVAGNAADGDGSQFGDHIYAHSARVEAGS